MIKAEKLKEYDPNKFVPGYCSPKYNGIHGTYDQELQKFYSRTPNEFQGLGHLELELMSFPQSVVGEIVIPGIPFQEASGKIRSHDETPEACFYIFNSIWPGVYFEQRYQVLSTFYEMNKEHFMEKQVFLIEPVLIHTTHEFDMFYNHAVNRGHEGVVWIHPYHEYQPGKRTWKWMKRVPLRSIEVTIKEVLPGTKGKKYEHSLGRFVCEMDDGKEVRVGIFKGHTDEWRQHVYDNGEQYLDKRATIEFKDYSSKGIPVQPRFKDFRWDL
jgi:ATP-dependent DNA ligase